MKHFGFRWGIRFGFAVASVTLLGCSSGTGGANPGQTITRTRPVFVDKIDDAVSTDNETITGSGEAAAAALREALRDRGIPLAAEFNASGYTLTAKLTHWEHHLTEWNGMPDVIEMSVELTDDRTGELAGTADARITGSALLLVHAMAERLLPDAANESIKDLYRR
jgi:hypothetical protein